MPHHGAPNENEWKDDHIDKTEIMIPDAGVPAAWALPVLPA